MELSRYENASPQSGMHTVVHGETLYEIAWRYGMDYRHLAKINHIASSTVLYSGQRLRITQGSKGAHAARDDSSLQDNSNRTEPHYSIHQWMWPAQGKIANQFSTLNKGINIIGMEGASIYAVQSGKVVYSGDGLRAYGNLIILKHNSLYLTAYAHNKTILVREGDWVKQGQKIAEMGHTGTVQTMLHFEIRKEGKPVDPLTLLGT